MLRSEIRMVELGRLILVNAHDPHQVIHDVGDTERGQRRISIVEEAAYLARRRLPLQVGEDGIGVQNGQRPQARTASSARA